MKLKDILTEEMTTSSVMSTGNFARRDMGYNKINNRLRKRPTYKRIVVQKDDEENDDENKKDYQWSKV